MRETLWWLIVGVALTAMFVALFAALLWMWSVSGVPRDAYAMFAAIGVFSALSAIVTFNVANWLKERYDD